MREPRARVPTSMSDDAAVDNDDGCKFQHKYRLTMGMVFSIVCVVLVVAVLMMGVRLASVILFFRRTRKSRRRPPEFFSILLHISAIMTGACVLIALTAFVSFWTFFFELSYECMDDDGLGTAMIQNAEIYWIGTFLSYAFYVIWLVCRDRALQCEFFRTRPVLIYPPAVTAVVTYFVFWFYYHSCKDPIDTCWVGHEKVESVQDMQADVAEPVRIFDIVEILTTVYFTWIFLKALGPTGVGGVSSPVLRDVLIRTGVGAGISFTLACVSYIVDLTSPIANHIDPDDSKDPKKISHASRIAYLNYTMFTVMNLFPKVLHIFLSHRDDVPFHRALQSWWCCVGREGGSAPKHNFSEDVVISTEDETRELDRLREDNTTQTGPNVQNPIAIQMPRLDEQPADTELT